MENRINIIDPLLSKAEDFAKTSLELLKLQSVDKTAELASSFISRLIFSLIALIALLSFNIAVALWIGMITGHNFYGFSIVAAFYTLCAIIIYFLHPTIKSNIYNAIVSKIMN
ncbi:MAG: hypothetical protein PSX81_05530 [bacterium]|nr:hypothetical protein [bacterium]